jgi:membrane dipeptidase
MSASRRDFLKQSATAVAAMVAAPMLNRGRYRLFAHAETEYSARAIALMQRATVIDMLSPFTLDFGLQAKWTANPDSFTDAQFRKFIDSGINIFHPAIGLGGLDPYQTALVWFAGWNGMLAGNSERLMRVDSPDDFARVKRSKKVGVLLGLQNSGHFRRPDDVDFFYSQGQRVSQLTYNARNRIGSGCQAPDAGLSPYGAEVVAAMNRAGMAVDISHCGDRTSLGAVAASRKPVLITHSNCRALVAHPRCKPDEVIRKVAAGGGVMGITVIPAFVRQGQQASLEDVLDHFSHVARLVGIEHAGLGSDADVDAINPVTRQVRPRYRVQGLKLARRVFELTDGLLRRGFSDTAVQGVLGGNFQRALTEIWGAPRPA